MPRRAYKIHRQRKLSLNTRGSSSLVQKFINQIVKDGKTRLAQNILYATIRKLSENDNFSGSESSYTEKLDTSRTSSVSTSSKHGIDILRQAVLNVTPLVEVKPRRIGGSVFQVPIEVPSERGTVLAVRWIVQSARNRPGRGMVAKLTAELNDAANSTGSAMKKREDVHRMAEANKAFAHYR